MPLSQLATVELQLILHHCDLASFLALARCSHFTLDAASAPFAGQYLPPLRLDFAHPWLMPYKTSPLPLPVPEPAPELLPARKNPGSRSWLTSLFRRRKAFKVPAPVTIPDPIPTHHSSGSQWLCESPLTRHLPLALRLQLVSPSPTAASDVYRREVVDAALDSFSHTLAVLASGEHVRSLDICRLSDEYDMGSNAWEDFYWKRLAASPAVFRAITSLRMPTSALADLARTLRRDALLLRTLICVHASYLLTPSVDGYAHLPLLPHLTDLRLEGADCVSSSLFTGVESIGQCAHLRHLQLSSTTNTHSAVVTKTLQAILTSDALGLTLQSLTLVGVQGVWWPSEERQEDVSRWGACFANLRSLQRLRLYRCSDVDIMLAGLVASGHTDLRLLQVHVLSREVGDLPRMQCLRSLLHAMPTLRVQLQLEDADVKEFGVVPPLSTSKQTSWVLSDLQSEFGATRLSIVSQLEAEPMEQ